MPGLLLPTTMEFLMVVADGKPLDPATAGGFRITNDGKAPPRLEVRVCADKADSPTNPWRAPRPGDLGFLQRVLAEYPDEFFDPKAAFASLRSAIAARLAMARDGAGFGGPVIDVLQSLANLAGDLAGGKQT